MFACKVVFGVAYQNGGRIVLHSALSNTFLCETSFNELGLRHVNLHNFDVQSLVESTKLKIIAAKAMPHEFLSHRCIVLRPTLQPPSSLQLEPLEPWASSHVVYVDVKYDEELASVVLKTYLHAKITEKFTWDRNQVRARNVRVSNKMCEDPIERIHVFLSESQPQLLPEILVARSAKYVNITGYNVDAKSDVSLVAQLNPTGLCMDNMTIDDVVSLIPRSVQRLRFENVRFSPSSRVEHGTKHSTTCFQAMHLACLVVHASHGFEDMFEQLDTQVLELANQHVPPSIAKWDKLKQLSLNACDQVDFVWLSQNLSLVRIDDTVVKSHNRVFNMPDLSTLLLKRARLGGALPSSVSNLVHLTWLGLAHNFFTGSIPSELFSLTLLQGLDLSYNFFSGTLSTCVKNLTSLEVLDLESNLLGGTVPTEIGTLACLRRLSLGYNNLTGGIPTEIGNLVGLHELSASTNQLCSLPTQLGNLRNLRVLDLSDNYLCGQIPTELGLLYDGVVVLNLSRNQLRGTIPSELGMISIETLDLSHNRLCGKVPKELERTEATQCVFSAQKVLVNNNSLVAHNVSHFDSLHFDLDENMAFYFASGHKQINKFSQVIVLARNARKERLLQNLNSYVWDSWANQGVAILFAQSSQTQKQNHKEDSQQQDQHHKEDNQQQDQHHKEDNQQQDQHQQNKHQGEELYPSLD